MAVKPIEELSKKLRDLFQKAVAAMERNNLDYAIDIFTNIVEAEPEAFEARKCLRLCELKEVQGKKSGFLSTLAGIGGMTAVQSKLNKAPLEALTAAEKLLRKDPVNKTFLRLHASAAEAADLPEVALHSLEVAKDQYPKDVAVLTRLGELYKKVGAPSKAKECYETIVQLKPKDPKAIKDLKDVSAIDTMQQGGWNDAGSYRDVIKDSDEAKRLEQSSKAVKTGRDVDDLIVEMKAKIENEPDNVNYRRAIADLYLKKEMYSEAIEMLEGVQKSSGGGDPQVDLAISDIRIKAFDHEIKALLAEGKKDEAQAKEEDKNEVKLSDARTRVKRYPNDLGFKYDLGVLLYEKDDITEAIQQFQMAQRNPKRRIKALYYLALCFKSKKQYDIAMEQLEKAATELHVMDDQKKEIIYELGLVNEAMGNMEKAVSYFKDIYAVDIGYKEVAQKIEKAYEK